MIFLKLIVIIQTKKLLLKNVSSFFLFVSAYRYNSSISLCASAKERENAYHLLTECKFN